MGEKYFYYVAQKKSTSIKIDDKFRLEFFNPSLFRLTRHKVGFKSLILYFYWYVLSLGKYSIVYIYDDETNNIAHYSNIITKIYKYAFMNKGDIFVLNCYTEPKYRGCKLYPFALQEIIKFYKSYKVWGMVLETNTASLKGIAKTSFMKYSEGYKSSFFGIYKEI